MEHAGRGIKTTLPTFRSGGEAISHDPRNIHSIVSASRSDPERGSKRNVKAREERSGRCA